MNKRLSLTTVFAFLVFTIIFTQYCIADTSDESFILGKYQLTNGNFDKAYDLLFMAFLNDPANPDINFFLGRSAFEKAMTAFAANDKEKAHRSLEAALMAFDRILIVQPEAVRIKLEIARCHMQLGSLEMAKQYFQEVLAANPPEAVKNNVNYLLAAIAATEKRHFITGTASLGLDIDDNARSTSVYFADIKLPGSGITLSNTQFGSTPTRDKTLVNTVSLNHIYKFLDTPYSWKTSFISYNTLHQDLKDLNINLFGINSGPSYQNGQFLFETHATLNDLSLGYDEYVRPIGVGGSATYLFDPKMIINSTFSLEKKKYSKPANTAQDATNFSITLSPLLVAGDNRVTFSLYREWENADTDFWSYDRIKWSLRYDRTLPDNFTAFISLTNSMTDYKAIQSGQTSIRSDNVQDFSVGISNQLWLSKNKTKSLTLQISLTHTNAESNLPAYVYRKKVISSLMTYGF